MLVVTSGHKYIDIDAYASMIAYSELLNYLERPAIAASTALWNESIPTSLRALHAPLELNYKPQPDDKFIVLDLSDPSQFDKLVQPENVVEVIDHHPGFENYWQQRISDGSCIEFVGACATLIYEQWKEAGLANRMSKVGAELLAAAILDNTLNFGAKVTTERDKDAYEFLISHAGLGRDWVATYFSDCQTAITNDLPKALKNDTKLLHFNNLPQDLCVGQIVAWDATSIIANSLPIIRQILSAQSDIWMANVISISDGKSHLITDSSAVQQWLQKLLGVQFDGLIAIADRMWLRKEILKAAQNKGLLS